MEDGARCGFQEFELTFDPDSRLIVAPPKLLKTNRWGRGVQQQQHFADVPMDALAAAPSVLSAKALEELLLLDPVEPLHV